jgi:hypothetical protein
MANLLTALTPAQIKEQARADVAAEIAAAINPLQTEIGGLQARGTAAQAEISKLFAGLQPEVSASAERLAALHGETIADERSIFDAATARLDEIRSSRAAEAQELAQQIGTPVPIDEFTQGVDVARAAQGQFEGSSLLHALAGGEANVGAAEAFAGRVFPQIAAEQQSRTQFQFDQAVNDLKKQIAQIESQRENAVNKQYYDRLLQEKTFQLQKIQADRDYRIAQQTLGMQKGELTGSFKGKPTLAAKNLAEQQRQFNAQLTLSNKELNAKISADVASGKATGKTETAVRWQNALELANGAMTAGKPYTISEWVPAAPRSPGAVQRTVGGKTGWYKLSRVTHQSPGYNRGQPGRIYKYLIARGVNKRMAVRAVRLATGKPNWYPVAADTRSGTMH